MSEQRSHKFYIEIKEGSVDAGAVFCEAVARRKESFPAQPAANVKQSCIAVPTTFVFWAHLVIKSPCVDFRGGTSYEKGRVKRQSRLYSSRRLFH